MKIDANHVWANQKNEFDSIRKLTRGYAKDSINLSVSDNFS